MSDKFVLDGYGVNRKFVDTGMTDPYGKPVHAEVIAFDGTPGGSTSPPVDGSGNPLDWPWQQTITDGTEYVLTWPDGRDGPLTVWKGPGDVIEIAKRDGDGQDWDLLVDSSAAWSCNLSSGSVYQLRFRRTAGSGSTDVGVGVRSRFSLPADASGAIAAGGLAQIALAASEARNDAVFQNTSDGELRFSEFGDPSLTVGWSVMPGCFYTARTRNDVRVWGAETGQTWAGISW